MFITIYIQAPQSSGEGPAINSIKVGNTPMEFTKATLVFDEIRPENGYVDIRVPINRTNIRFIEGE